MSKWCIQQEYGRLRHLSESEEVPDEYGQAAATG
jgi:hypothetical protein